VCLEIKGRGEYFGLREKKLRKEEENCVMKRLMTLSLSLSLSLSPPNIVNVIKSRTMGRGRYHQ
jgi:hypothetical protein